MVTYKQLDAILFFIQEKTNLGAEINEQYIWNLYVGKTPELGIGPMLFKDILQKLIDDGYVTKSSDNAYHLTVNGRNFKGYQNGNSLLNRVFTKGVKEGIIYSLIVAIILALVAKLFGCKS